MLEEVKPRDRKRDCNLDAALLAGMAFGKCVSIVDWNDDSGTAVVVVMEDDDDDGKKDAAWLINGEVDNVQRGARMRANRGVNEVTPSVMSDGRLSGKQQAHCAVSLLLS